MVLKTGRMLVLIFLSLEAGAHSVTGENFSREIRGLIARQHFDPANIGICVMDITDPSVPRVAEFEADQWWYPASTTKVIVLGYVYYAATRHAGPDEPFRKTEIDKWRHDIELMIRQSWDANTTHIVNYYGRAPIRA